VLNEACRMPTERLSMRLIRDVLRLKYETGLSERAVSASLGIGKGAIGSYLSRARAAGLSWPLPPELGDAALERLLFPGQRVDGEGCRPVPDPLCQGSCPASGYDFSFSAGRDGGVSWPTRRSAVRRF
jgi:hypothetical protein